VLERIEVNERASLNNNKYYEELTKIKYLSLAETNI
jgi:hypothetical protein